MPSAITSTKPAPSPDSKPLPDWLAVVYAPNKEPRPRSALNELLGSAAELPQPAHPLILGLPIEEPENYETGMVKTSRFIRLNPGTNLGVSTLDWSQTTLHPLIAPKLSLGIIQIFTPTFSDEVANPGYRCFLPEVAVQLIALTLHEDWIEHWLVGEARAVVLEAGARQKAELMRVKAARAAA